IATHNGRIKLLGCNLLTKTRLRWTFESRASPAKTWLTKNIVPPRSQLSSTFQGAYRSLPMQALR
ncbi:MAG TPA: hypothetical protein VNH83_08745, partial [Bryobacteraceae bacterium]|nr:hypothetical protein [Bryobacteraceae bacterium]